MRTSSTFRLLRGRFALGLLVVATTLVTARAVTFPDSRLEAAVRDALNQPSGEITAADMLTLTELDAAGRGIKDTSGLETALNLQALHFSGNPATNYTGVAGLVNLTLLEWGDGQIRDTTFLAGLQALTRLYFNSNPVTNFSGIAGLSNLTQLTFDFGAISDLTFLTDLTKLRSLEIYQNQIQDISPLSALRDLQTLQLDWNSVTNLNVLSGLTNLLNLSLAGNGVTNIDFVAPLQHLQSLGLYIDHVSDLSPLAGRTNLLALGVGWNKVTNPAVIATLTGLQSLGLNGNDLTNVPYLAGLTNLTSLSLDYTLLEDMSPVTNLTRLNDLNVGENSLTRLPDLSSLTNLKAFMMAGNQITDLWPLTNLAGVDQLHLQRNLFQDLSPLAYVPGLRNLLLSGNALTNLSPLQALTNLCSLEMETMQLSDLGFLAPLAGLRELDLSDNQVVGLSALTNLPWLYWLRVDHNRLQEINPLLDCQSLREVKLQANLLDTNAISAAWNIITNLQARGVTVEFDPQYPLSVLPAISVQPRTQSAFTNTAVTFNVLATSTAPKLYYRWQKNGLDLADGGSFAGTDTDTLHASGITAAEGGLYRVRVWTDFGITNSLAAELRIITNVFFPDPSLEQAVRDALAIPSDPLTPADLVGLSSLDASSYGITNLAGIEALADLAGLNLSGNPAIASFQSLSYLAALNDLTVNKCGLENLGWLSALPTLNQVGFADNFVDDLSPLRAIGSLMNVYASGNQLTDITPLLDLSALAYVDVARNRLDTNATSAAWAVITNLQARSVTVEYDPQYGAPVRPEIVEQPVDVVAYLGADVSFSVIASGGGPGFNYQWQKNGINQLNDSHVSGTRTDTLNISGVTAADAGAYRVRIWNDLGVTNSRSARLRVISSVAFVDPNLERAVRESLGIPSGPITLDDLKSLTVLIAHGFGITNLAGLDAAISLTYLNLAANPGITDFTLLADLPALRQVFLDECIVPDLTFASALPWLWEFTARGGGVSDLSPLAGCPKLEILDLGGKPALTN